MAKRARSVVATAAGGLARSLAAAPLLVGLRPEGPLVAAKTAGPPASAPATPCCRSTLPAPCCRRRRRADGDCPALPTSPGATASSSSRSVAVADLARRFGTPLYVYSSAAMARALAAVPARARRPRPPALLRDEGQLEPGGAADVRTPAAAASTSSRAASSSACSPPAATPSRVVFSGVGKTRAEMRARARRRRAVLQRRERRRARAAVARSPRPQGAARARQPARQSRRRPEDPSLHLDRPAGQQVRHRPRATRAPHSRAPRACPGLEVVGIDCHIGSQIVDASPTSTRSIACSTWSRRSKRDGLPLRHLDLGGGLGITYADETPPPADALVARLLERIDARGHGHRKIVLEPGRSLVGNAGVLVSEVLYLKPGEREELLHRRRGDERPDAAGDVRRLDARSSSASRAPARRRRLRRRRAGLRIGRLARPRPRARRRAGRLRRRALRRRLRHEHGEQLQHPAARRRGDGGRRARPG